MESIHRYRIGTIHDQWQNFTPPIQGGHFRPGEEKDRPEVSDGAINRRTAVEPDEKVHWSITSSPEESISSEDYIRDRVLCDIESDIAKYPSLDALTQQNIAHKFQELHRRVKDEGFYVCSFQNYGWEMVRYAALFALFVFALNYSWYMTSACFLGLFWHQIMFTAHDAGHRGITHDFTTDTLVGILIANVCCGLSIGWWKSSHNVHHLVTNLPEHDPDIQNVPLFATSSAFFGSIRSSYYGIQYPWDAFAHVAVKFQKYTYYPVMAVARFNLYFLSWAHLLSPRSQTKGRTAWIRPTEIAGITLYTILYFYVLLYLNIPTWHSRILFLLISHLVTMPLHVQITLSHWGTSTADLGPTESFAQRQLRTTMDVECPAWLDFVHGGLQFQAVHHLFPRVPRHNLRRLRDLVKEFCAETEIEYLSHGFVDGNGVVLSRLQEIADQAGVLAACQAHMAATGESALH